MGKTSKPKKVYANKHEAFLAVATPRVNKALKAIELLGNQAGAAYAPTKTEVAGMLASLRKKVDDVESIYKGGVGKVGGFSFE